MLLSIIIPVYQVEDYLEQCLDTLLQCDLWNCEIFLSLGKSTDKSNEIAYRYEKEYPIIHTLFQKGTGLSDARNSAMEVAKGDYFLFLDSDDYIIPQNLDFIIEHLKNGTFQADVIMSDFYELNNIFGQIIEHFQIGIDSPIHYGIDFISTILCKRQNFWSIWRYIYRRSFLEKYHLLFLKDMMAEDVEFTTSVFLAEPDMIFCHSPYYVYRVGRTNSLMDQVTLKRLTDTVTILERSVFRAQESSFQYGLLLATQFQLEYLRNLPYTLELGKEEQYKGFLLYRNWREVLNKSSKPVIKIAALGIQLIGIPMAARLLYQLKLVKRWIKIFIRKTR